jgi:hypothetical protein
VNDFNISLFMTTSKIFWCGSAHSSRLRCNLSGKVCARVVRLIGQLQPSLSIPLYLVNAQDRKEIPHGPEKIGVRLSSAAASESF